MGGWTSVVRHWCPMPSSILYWILRVAKRMVSLHFSMAFFFFNFRFYAAEIAIGLFFLQSKGIIYRYVSTFHLLVCLCSSLPYLFLQLFLKLDSVVGEESSSANLGMCSIRQHHPLPWQNSAALYGDNDPYGLCHQGWFGASNWRPFAVRRWLTSRAQHFFLLPMEPTFGEQARDPGCQNMIGHSIMKQIVLFYCITTIRNGFPSSLPWKTELSLGLGICLFLEEQVYDHSCMSYTILCFMQSRLLSLRLLFVSESGVCNSSYTTWMQTA